MRSNFVKIKAEYQKAGKGAVRLTQSSLFLLQDIKPTQAAYTFPVLENETATLDANEVRLNMNDEFIATGLGLYLAAKAEKEIEGVVTLLPGLFLMSYPNLEQVADAGKAQPFYDGTIKIAVNNIVYVEKWDTRKHRVAQRTQWAATKAAGGVTLPQASTIPSIDFAKDAMYPVQPMVTFSGAKKNEISLILPQAGDGFTFSNVANDGVKINFTVNKIALMLRGYNGQNAAKFQ